MQILCPEPSQQSKIVYPRIYNEPQGDDSMATIQVNFTIDAQLKQQADEVFDNIGLSLNDALRMFVKQAVLCRGLPLVTREAEMLYAQPNPQLTESQTRELLELLNDPEACQKMQEAGQRLLEIRKLSKIAREKK